MSYAVDYNERMIPYHNTLHVL